MDFSHFNKTETTSNSHSKRILDYSQHMNQTMEKKLGTQRLKIFHKSHVKIFRHLISSFVILLYCVLVCQLLQKTAGKTTLCKQRKQNPFLAEVEINKVVYKYPSI